VSARLRKIIDHFGGASPVILAVGLLIIASAWFFVELADEVVEGDSRQFDEWVLQSLRDPADPAMPRGPTWLKLIMADITALGGVAVLCIMTTAVVGYMLMTRKFAAIALILGATIGGVLVGSVLKQQFARPRPSVVPHLTEVLTHSFPSGHSMYSAIVYLTLGALLTRLTPGWREKIYLIVVALGIIFLIGISRIYLGVHYPTDVLAGWTAGLAWALLCWLVARYLQRKGAVEKEDE